MESVLTKVLGVLVLVAEACGALVIAVEVVRTIVRFAFTIFRPRTSSATPLRMRLGQSMVLGLEFQVAADILKTALSPEWNDILQLAALIALRTVLNYLMEHELDTLSRKRVSANAGEQETTP
jgi:uncharacterized membrane protein